MNLTTTQLLDRAMIQTLRNDPFYATVLLGLKVQEDKNMRMPTMATDGKSLKYHPDFVNKLSTKALASVITHEGLHIVLGHHLRATTLQKFKQLGALIDGKEWAGDWEAWQIACDCEVNSLLQDRPDFPKEATTATKCGLPEGKLAEWYYDKLERQRPPEDGKGKGPGAGNTGTRLGDVEPHPDMTGDASKDGQLQQEWQSVVTRAALAAKEAGKLPGWMEERLEALLKPAQVNWRTALRQFATETVKSGVCWSRPSRRMHHIEGFMPDHRSRSIGKVFLIEDTSGSMDSAKWHPQICGELANIMQSFPQSTVRVIQCDTRIVLDKTFKSGQGVDVEFMQTVKGRGGTDMTEAFKLVRKENAQCAILLTDGEMNFPKNPGIPVMWLETNEFEVPYGKKVKLE